MTLYYDTSFDGINFDQINFNLFSILPCIYEKKY